MTRALLSVSDKSGLIPFAKNLVELGYELVSTGGTHKVLVDAGLDVISIDEVTDFPEMLDGRVKTLHPRVHAGLLARRDLPEHMAKLAEFDITPIDMVVVNLYPFKSTIQKDGVTEAEAIENIDIGGPSMLRSAAKNFASVLPIVDPKDYDVVVNKLKAGEVDREYRKSLAAKVFQHTASYDALIANYLTETSFPENLTLAYEKFDDMRYGENPHQSAAAYKTALPESYSVLNADILHGKQLSYNNIRDADAALRIIAEYEETTVVTVKHMNPAGIGQGQTLEAAWDQAFAADDISIFGGIVALNREVDAATAEKMHAIFLEIIIAPSFTPEAYEILAAKKNLRLLTLPFTISIPQKLEVTSVLGGVVVQERDLVGESENNFTVVSKAQPTKEQLQAMIFAQKVVKHVKSNAIVVARNGQTLGIGAGQPNRIDSVVYSIQKAEKKPGFDEAVLASDAFFPMDDSVQYAAEHGIKAIVEPGGSIKDKDSIAKADELGVVLIFSGTRHFKH
ncbi:bifunctional phosphoribosylaminoimidazolecarboxamide formyltransferase/inosine monophosphate cyclohydrolase [Leuconostoc mesenteroides subsp. mesenteroides J18]|uniref:bifunctional phosphoribosylaminoimidazolecarboxamide formyltransferase/IMP cyclohydrolase n=1 Tax=Leuconostoc mesenteroides TaxID=1245 RepID=UPI00023409D6|nr:bifunctional phosphoribosylaminoimidazolecarboxamide formyltransferase/IMP cyclohydrolase [Leuconostoc mesenteroides]AET30125.1 bifunctional phosphoribosylaminoimidazolecarboxamide formyltransferase/inosine monophosphate cyclohydrolase [Leuconostoc mesenteroides subsp. mesenteroides J18]AQU49110.1 bifunctional phosphoribosylaminoimidazolecarboxamide formyltransferase/inosine monophosphate cyclohydrolase [Leuconostoc mesenteroides subsp. mesenteroides]